MVAIVGSLSSTSLLAEPSGHKGNVEAADDDDCFRTKSAAGYSLPVLECSCSAVLSSITDHPRAVAPTIARLPPQLVLADRLCAHLATIEPATPGISPREDNKPRVPMITFMAKFP